jgi:hypothetical protein
MAPELPQVDFVRYPAPTTIEAAMALQQHAEWLRQMQETFDQQKVQDQRSFRLSQALGWLSIVIIPAIAIFSAYALISSRFDHELKAIAGATLFGDVVGLAGITWKVNARRGAPPRLAPTIERVDPAGTERGDAVR